MKKVFIVILITILLGLWTKRVFFKDRVMAQENPSTYISWWPQKATPWVYGQQVGGISYSTYEHRRDYLKLEEEFKRLIEYHQPNYLLVFFDFKIIQKPKVLPEGNNTLNQVRGNFDFSYYDDLIAMASANKVKIILYPEFSPYGGQAMYPFTYYSKAGWFWQRPDWPYGLANPTSDAVRHPPSVSDYNWIEHEAGYLNVAADSDRHWPLTTDGKEDTGLGNWQVYESPDMVFNGYDTMLHNGTLHLHSPIPSFSSQAYRDFLFSVYGQIAEHYANKAYAFYLWQEPSYHHLRENMNYGGFSGVTLSGDSSLYEVDYSSSELARYNNWRSQNNKGNVTQIPYPTDNDYETFKKWNLADFQKNLANSVRQKAPEIKILLSVFFDDGIKNLSSDPQTLIKEINPDILTLEPPRNIGTYEGNLTKIINSQAAIPSFFLSYFILDAKEDVSLANGFSELIVPALSSGAVGNPGTKNSETAYAHWPAGGCNSDNCNERYHRPGIFLTTGDLNFDGKVDILDLRQLLANFSTSLGIIIFDYNKIVENFGL